MNKKTKNTTKLILSILFLLIAMYISRYAVKNLYVYYPNLQPARDIFFDKFAFMNLSWLSDTIIILGLILFAVFIIRKDLVNKIPFYFTVLGIFHLIRAIFVYLTPLANPFPLDKWGLNIMPEGGMFPSGHTATLYLYFLFSLDEKKCVLWKIIFAVMIVVEMITLLLSRGHYTIDVISAVFVAYTIYVCSQKYLKKHLILK